MNQNNNQHFVRLSDNVDLISRKDALLLTIVESSEDALPSVQDTKAQKVLSCIASVSKEPHKESALA